MRTTLIRSLFLPPALCCCGVVQAASLQASVTGKNSQYLEGANLTNDSPAVSLSADWTFNNGVFAGLECYTSSVDISEGLDSGCDYYAGYFKPLKNTRALSLQVTQHDYSRGLNHKWDFIDVSASWHLNKRTRFSAVYSENWLNRPFDTLAIKGETQMPLADRLKLNISASVMAIESGAPVDNLVFAKASILYSRDRWTTEAGIIYTDKEQRRMVPFEVDQAELLLTVSYRLY